MYFNFLSCISIYQIIIFSKKTRTIDARSIDRVLPPGGGTPKKVTLHASYKSIPRSRHANITVTLRSISTEQSVLGMPVSTQSRTRHASCRSNHSHGQKWIQKWIRPYSPYSHARMRASTLKNNDACSPIHAHTTDARTFLEGSTARSCMMH